MPVTISRTVSIKDKDGNISILTETDQIAESTDISAKCDSSRCASRHDGKTSEVAWNIEEVKEKPDALPDSFFRLLSLIVNPRSQEQKVFCSAGCVRDFLQYDYVAPLSPREEAVLQANNAQAELAKHRPKTNVVPFPGNPNIKIEAPPAPTSVEVADTPIDIITEKPGPEGVSGHSCASGCPVGAEGVEGPEGVSAEEPKPFSVEVAPLDPVETPVFIPREGA